MFMYEPWWWTWIWIILGLEYFKQDSKRCDLFEYGNYSTLEEAQLACTADTNCQGVFDFAGDEIGRRCIAILEFIIYVLHGIKLNTPTYALCSKYAQLRTFGLTSVYTKRKIKNHFQIIIKIIYLLQKT